MPFLFSTQSVPGAGEMPAPKHQHSRYGFALHSTLKRDDPKAYTWNGGKCLGWYLLESPGFNVKLEKIPPGGTTNMHYHKGMAQFFFVTSGVLSIETNGEVIEVHSGHGINLEGEVKHRVHNNSSDWVTYTVSERFSNDCSTYYN